MSVRYGNLPLGQVSKLLVSIIGRDAAITVVDEHNKLKTEKAFDRMFEGKEGSFTHLRPSEKNSPIELICKFFQSIEKPVANEKKRKPLVNRDKNNSSEENNYEIPRWVKSLVILSFFCVYRDALRTLVPYEMKSQHIVLHLLNWLLGCLGTKIQDTESQDIYTIPKTFVGQLLDDTYQIIFDEIVKKTAKNEDDFYKQLGAFYREKYPNSEKLPDFKQTIKRYCQGISDVTWKTLKPILDFVYSKGEKELVHRLIGLYLLKNTEAALKEICGIEQKDIYRIKQDVRLWANNELPPTPESESQCFLMTAGKYNPSDLSLLQRDFIDPDFYEQITAIEKCKACLWGNNHIELDKAEQLIQEMEEKCPHCGIFFASWARARLAVLSCKFDGSEEDKYLQKQALESYHTAFDKGRNFAGATLKGFLEESIATTVYFNRRRIQDIPKVIDSDKSLKTPITDDVKESEERDASYGAKQYYEYGYALNLFEQESSETYLLHFHAEEHFWKVFSTSLFIHTESARKRCDQDLLKAKGLFVIEGGKEELEQYQKSQKEKLEGVTEKTINRRMEIQPGHNIKYTPLSIAIITHQIDIAERYLKNFKKELDVTVINTNGSNALLEALTQYKKHRFFEWDEQRAERYKKIIMELIKIPEDKKINSFYAETIKNHISVLEEAVNVFDIEIIKAIVEKKGFNIQSLKISADELSPLYYTIMRCYFVSNLISTGKISDDGRRNINWEKLNVPGIFTEDRKAYYENMTSDPSLEAMEESSNYMFCGKPEIWNQELLELKEIVKYLADKTDDVNAFIKEAPNGGHTTALSLAVESDFDDICRLLVEKGANPARIFRNNGIPYDSHLFRVAWFKSWKTLEMMLINFKDKIKPIINERYREDKETVAHLLFRVDYGHVYQYSVNSENFKFIEHFIPLFRSVGAEFDIPNNGNITVRQILKKNNLEYLLN